VLAGGILQTRQILPQCDIIELRQKLWGHRCIKLTDLIDELTFVHDSFTFAETQANAVRIESDKHSDQLETQSVMQETRSDHPQTTSTSTPVVDDDPLAHLHKMSTTAGLGSQEYVAVNGMAVFALVLGLASGFALFDRLFLVIPLITIIISIFAILQIRRSNGTQTGLGLVGIALLLALVFGGIVGTQWGTEGFRTREDRRAITAMAQQLGENVKVKKYDEAYKLFSSRFQQNVPFKTFQERIGYMTESSVWGKLKDVQTGLMQFQTDESTGAKFAVVRMLINFEKGDRPVPDDLTVRKEQDQWRIEGFPSLFPPQRGAGGAGGGG